MLSNNNATTTTTTTTNNNNNNNNSPHHHQKKTNDNNNKKKQGCPWRVSSSAQPARVGTAQGGPSKRWVYGAPPSTTANLRTKILDFRGFGSGIVFMLRGGTPMPIGNFLEILVGIILVGRLGVPSATKSFFSRFVQAAVPGLTARAA